MDAMEALNQKQLSTLEFMHRYGDVTLEINDGRIVGVHEESPAPASNQG